MTMVSFAQNGEDVRLDRVFARGRPGFYIDVGACDPSTASVTRHFYDLGWHGINVEPTRASFDRLGAERGRDVNLNVALSDAAGDLVLHEFEGVDTGVSTASAVHAERHHQAGLASVEHTVPALTLAEVCERHVTGSIDFLSVDVEGHEREVLAGADFDRWRPRVILVEATEPATLEEAIDTPRLLPASHETWEPILTEARYRFVAFDGINRFYVREEDADLAPALAVPVNVLDGYVTYAQFRAEKDIEVLRRQQYAGWVANQTMRAEFQGLAGELDVLRQQYERLERALTTAREACERARGDIAAAGQLVDGARDTGARVREETGQVSPMALAVARRLTAASSTYPQVARPVKLALRAGRGLKGRLDGARKGATP